MGGGGGGGGGGGEGCGFEKEKVTMNMILITKLKIFIHAVIHDTLALVSYCRQFLLFSQHFLVR